MSDHGHSHGHDHPHEHPASPATPVADASVRLARINDAPAVGLVQSAVFTSAYADRLPPEVVALFQPSAFAAGWRDSLASPPAGAHALFVALAGAQVVGLIAVGPSQDPDADADQAEITLLGVHPDGRRQGHGSRLLQAGADHLGAMGASTVAVWVLVNDEPTRAFLQGAGFGPDGARRDRVVSPDGAVLREVRLTCLLGP